MNTNQYQPDSNDNLFNVQKLLQALLDKWYLIIFSVGICLAIAYFIDRYTKPVYITSSMLYIKPANDKTNISNILYGGEGYGSTRNLSNEIIFLKSNSLIEKTIKDLDFYVNYSQKGKFVTSELYKSSPIEVIVDTTSSFIPYYTKFTCSFKNPQSILLTTEDENLSDINTNQYKIGQLINIKGFRFSIQLKHKNFTPGSEVIFHLNNLDGLTNYYRNALFIGSVSKESSVLKLSLEGNTPEKDKDFLNQLSTNLIQNNLNEKNSISGKTVGFINLMLTQNKDSLATIENKLEKFKGTNTVISVQEKGSQLMEDIKQLEKDKAVLLTANQYFDYLGKNLLSGDDKQIVIPSSIGVQDATLNTIIGELITLQSENRMLKADKKLKNPYIEVNNQKIEEIKGSILERIKSLKAVNEIRIADINKNVNQYVSFQEKLPSAEREFNDISRNYVISESLVQFLMEKRAEAAITQASNTSDYRIVDTARIENGPLKKKPFDYKMALLLGLALPIGFIFLLDSLNNKISSRDELLKLSPLPLLGIIVRGSPHKSLTDQKNLKTALSESLRAVRSNLSYLSDNSGHGKIILLTSSISGEGKSFCSINIGHIQAISGKKTVLINADMRKPTSYQKELDVKNTNGLSHYLSGKTSLSAIIQKTTFEDLYIIQSGDVPPNPSELLLSTRMKELLAELKLHFDYIILDTPPIGIIADAMELMNQSDVNIIVVRQGYTKKAFLHYINELYHSQKYQHMALLFNDVNMKKSSSGYGIGGYGYGYYTDDTQKNKWWKKLLPM